MSTSLHRSGPQTNRFKSSYVASSKGAHRHQCNKDGSVAQLSRAHRLCSMGPCAHMQIFGIENASASSGLADVSRAKNLSPQLSCTTMWQIFNAANTHSAKSTCRSRCMRRLRSRPNFVLPHASPTNTQRHIARNLGGSRPASPWSEIKERAEQLAAPTRWRHTQRRNNAMRTALATQISETPRRNK